jgi:poly-gamma-glutamate synthesis protein (capsule biosynthesis protein)
MKPNSPSRRALWLFLFASLGLAAALFAACGNPTSPEVTPTPTRTPRPTDTPTPSPTPTPAWPVTLFVPQGLPAPIADAVSGAMGERPDLFVTAPSAEEADVQVVLGDASDTSLLAEWVYVVVAPFSTLTDEVVWADVTGSWSGTPAGPFADRPLMMDEGTHDTLTSFLGSSLEGAVSILPSDQLVDVAWAARPSWAIVPFDQLEPRWKVLRVDGASVLDKEMDTAAYPLVVRVGVSGTERGVAKLLETLGGSLANRDPAKMTVLAMTGVTALARCTATTMEQRGVTYPGEGIRDWLLEPDITHISNEVSFAENCPPPACVATMMFCSSPRYIELVEDLDIDVVELTGNHLLDWGVEPMRNTLRMLEERSIPYFGGGWHLTQAQSPLVLTHGPHSFGFVGCNPVGPDSDWATGDRPGSAPCPGYDYAWLISRIQGLREQGAIPIVTLQYWEFDRFEPTPQQRADFRALSEAGAVIVSGSQAHHPQAFDFQGSAFIHYGLGNTFFDQTQMLEYRESFVDLHVFHDGRHVSTELLTAMRDDYAKPRPMTPEEREAFLRAAFAASGW